jgi:hypothetical protein
MVTPKKYEYSKILRNRSPDEYFNGLSYESRKLLTQLFRSIIDSEATAEQRRKFLADYPGFSSYEYFELIKGKYSPGIIKDDVIIFIYLLIIVVSIYS